MKCAICGSTENIIKHHTSYGREETIWLCRSCHVKVHQNPTHILYPEDKPTEFGKRPAIPKIQFYAPTWRSGDRLVVPIRKSLTQIYSLDGKFAKVTLEVLGEWK